MFAAEDRTSVYKRLAATHLETLWRQSFPMKIRNLKSNRSGTPGYHAGCPFLKDQCLVHRQGPGALYVHERRHSNEKKNAWGSMDFSRNADCTYRCVLARSRHCPL